MPFRLFREWSYYRAFGVSYIDMAFKLTREACGLDVKLILNDAAIETPGSDKQKAFLDLVKQLQGMSEYHPLGPGEFSNIH